MAAAKAKDTSGGMSGGIGRIGTGTGTRSHGKSGIYKGCAVGDQYLNVVFDVSAAVLAAGRDEKNGNWYK